VRIQINGEQREFPQNSLSLNELLDRLSLPSQRIAVELNKAIVPRSQWEKTIVGEDDQIEIVHFVGGGHAEGRTPLWSSPSSTTSSKQI
jgi:sulfur carrier protein